MKQILIIIVALIALGISSCKKDNSNNRNSNALEVITLNITDILPVTAKSGGIIVNNDNDSIISKGICWNTTQNPTINNDKLISYVLSDTFNLKLIGLSINTKYYVRAFATTSTGTTYGNEINFTTLDNFPNCGTVTDIDGNIYNTVTIGSQCWMVENYRAKRYRNGTYLQNITVTSQWTNLTYGAYCYFNNDTLNEQVYGKLYNWYAASSGILAPTGWHVANNSDWNLLISTLGGEGIAGGKLKSLNLWSNPNDGATNETGFAGIPNGARYGDGAFVQLGTVAYYWSSSSGFMTAPFYYLGYGDSYLRYGFVGDKKSGYAIRCIKD